jgi:hypothetical protein
MKCGLDLSAQRLELRPRELLAQLCGFGLLMSDTPPAFEREIDRQNEGVQHQTRQQSAVVELRKEQGCERGLMRIGPRIEQQLECRAPRGGGRSDADGRTQMQCPSGEAARPGQWVPTSEPDHQGRCQCPGQPGEHQCNEEADPVVLHSLGAHREDRL